MDNQLYIANGDFLGSGWSFPVTFTVINHQLCLSQFEKNVNESIDVILQTNRGERILQPEFGSGLQQFLFRKMDETLKGEIIDAVKAALLFSEPRITVTDVDVTFNNITDGSVAVQVSYLLNQTNTRHNYVFPFHINEGTNILKA